MSHTNSTTHYSLPQFVGTDTPGWLTDVNAAMLALDNAIYARQQAIAANTEAITANTASINGHTTRIEALEGSVSTIETDLDAAETNISNLQTTTQQHTNQISSLANTVTNLAAADISYDNTNSGLTATETQAAIDEVVTMIPASPDIVMVTGTTASAPNNFGTLIPYPDGFTSDNCAIISLEVLYSNVWRSGTGIDAADKRLFVEQAAGGVQAYHTGSGANNLPIRVFLMKIA